MDKNEVKEILQLLHQLDDEKYNMFLSCLRDTLNNEPVPSVSPPEELRVC